MANALLTYTITPATISAGETGVSFTVNAANNTSAAVTFNPADSIRIGQLSQLTSGTVSPNKPAGNWYFMLQAGVLRAFASPSTSIAAGDTLQLVFSRVTVLGVPGTAQLTVVETIGGVANNAPNLSVVILAALSITASATPSTVGLGQRSQIQWTAVGAAYVTISPGPATQYPVPAGNTWVIPAQNQPDTVYTVTAVAAGGATAPKTVTITMAPPQITLFQAAPLTGATIPGNLLLRWTTLYASTVQLQPQSGSPTVPLNGQLPVSTTGLLTGDQNEITFTLTATGYGPPVSQTQTVSFAPMQILWFRYADFTKAGYSFYVPNMVTAQVSGSGPYTLAAHGPGGPLTATLGGPGLQIQVVLSVPATITSGQSAELQYLLANTTSATQLTLSPGDVPLTFDPTTGMGHTTVSPPGTTPYVLTATDGSTTVTSQFTLVVTS